MDGKGEGRLARVARVGWAEGGIGIRPNAWAWGLVVLLASPARAPSRVWIGRHSTKMVPAPHFLSGPRRSEQRGFLFAAETAGIREGSREPRGVMQPLDALEAGYSRPKMRPAYV